MLNEFYTSKILDSLDSYDFKKIGKTKQEYQDEVNQNITNLVNEKKYTEDETINGDLFFKTINHCFNDDFLNTRTNSKNIINQIRNKDIMTSNVENASDKLDILMHNIVLTNNENGDTVDGIFNELSKNTKSSSVPVVKKSSFKITAGSIISFFVSFACLCAGIYCNTRPDITSYQETKEKIGGIIGWTLGLIGKGTKTTYKEVSVASPLKSYAPILFIAAIVMLVIGIIVSRVPKEKKNADNSIPKHKSKQSELLYIKHVLTLTELYYEKEEW